MPAVKPAVTGNGMNLIITPSRTAPMRNRIRPASIVQRMRLAAPYCAPTATTMGMKAAVGPPIWTRDPPSAEMRNPATMAVTMPAAGVELEAMPSAIASESATTPTVAPAARSGTRSARE
jgi:hypothetical protein